MECDHRNGVQLLDFSIDAIGAKPNQRNRITPWSALTFDNSINSEERVSIRGDATANNRRLACRPGVVFIEQL